jgi:hypothetical protein
MRPPAIAACIVALASIAGVAGSAPVFELAKPGLLYTVAVRYQPSAWLSGDERFPTGATIFLEKNGKPSPLVPAFAVSADPEISFDGQRVLFAGKQKPGDRWAIWELTLSNAALQRITPKSDDDYIRPFYLPEDRLVYTHRQNDQFVLETMALGGGKALPVSFGPGNFLPSDVLRDGRILFQARFLSAHDAHAELYTVYPDGSGVESYRCDHGNSRQLGRELSSGDIVFAESRGLARFTSALAQEVKIDAPSGDYAGDVAETGGGDWLLTWRENTNKHFAVKRWNPGTRVFEAIASDPTHDIVQPVLLQARDVPKRFPSAVHDWSVANLLCLNAYTSKYTFRAGSIASVRVYTRDQEGKPQALGSASVEPDGSFYVQIPGDQALQFELLDSSGHTLKREANWFWARRGEQRICVGCHAGPETAPENAVPAVLLKSTVPADLTGSAKAHEGGH